MLLDGALNPITKSIGLVEADCRKVAEIYCAWTAEVSGASGIGAEAESRNDDLRTILVSLAPLSVPSTRFAFVQTQSHWTAYFDNFRLGTDAGSRMSELGRRVGCRAIRITSVEHTIRKGRSDGEYGGVILSVTGALGETIRTISVVNDGGRWTFDAFGDPFPFEVPEAYKRKRIRDRFTHEMLVDYLQHLNVRPFDEDWYAPNAIVVQKSGFPYGVDEFPLKRR